MRAASFLAGIIFLGASAPVPGQTPAKEEFEVATVK
jgi:hypothetical protein